MQFSADSLKDYDAMIELENNIISGLGNLGEVDGHDMGAGEMNIFVRTNHPKLAFEKIKEIPEIVEFMPDLKAAYRDVGTDIFTIVYPPGLKHFMIA